MIRVDTSDKGVTIYEFINRSDGKREYRTFEGKTKVVKSGDPAPWVMALGIEDTRALADQLADYMADKSPEHAYLQGRLSVLEPYVDDLRKLLFLEKTEP